MPRSSLIGNKTRYFGTIATYDANGAIALTDGVALLNGSEATCAMTLADGVEGQELIVKAVDVTEVCSVAPDNMADGDIITFTDKNSAVRLIFDGSNWNVVNTYLTVVVGDNP